MPPGTQRGPARWLVVACALLLFAVWSNSFIAISYLLGRDGARARFDFAGLTAARFLTAALICAVYCVVRRPAESLALLRAHGGRLLACAFLAVPAYNLSLYYGQQHGVPAPVASLTTTLVPLFVMVLAAATLGERLTRRRLLGFGVALAGMIVIASAKKSGVALDYPLLIGITALAPLSWSLYSVLGKPLMGRVSPTVWTYLSIVLGGLLVSPLLLGDARRQWAELDPIGWAALLYLAVPCTVLGFALWSWLLRHLPASSVAFTVFLNPPLTTTSKYLLAMLLPAVFSFTILPREWLGGLLALAGVAIAMRR